MTLKPGALARPIIAVDPGRAKCGVAVVSPGQVPFRALVPTAELGLTVAYLLGRAPEAAVVVGSGTGSAAVVAALQSACSGVVVHFVPEAGSTLEARSRYWRDHGPRGWQRLLPPGLRVPPRPVDDYAALVLSERWLADQAP